MEIVAKLLFLKKRDALTARQISERSGIPLGTLNKIYSGATKNPSAKALEQIARVFHVPTRYFTDDGIAPEHAMIAITESDNLLGISQHEYECLCALRQFSTRERQTFDVLMRTMHDLYHASPCLENSVNLFCYVSSLSGSQAVDARAIEIRQIAVAKDAVSLQCDFAVLLPTKALEPHYPYGAMVGVRREPVGSDEIGVFLLNGQGFVRLYQCTNGVRKLVTINRHIPNQLVREQDNLQCLGRVIGLIHPLHRNFSL